MKLNLLLALALSMATFTTGCETYRSQFGDAHRSPGEDTAVLRLDLSGGQLQRLPDNLESLHKLRMLNLSDNPDIDLPDALVRICALPKISTLLLEGMNLRELPAAIRGCRSLTSISLARNSNLQLPDALAKLSQVPVEFLNLSDNDLRGLPDGIRALHRLEDLRLSHNRITDAGAFNSLSALPELYTLWLDHNRYVSVPETIGSLQQIRYLYLDHNEIAALPGTMADMRRLKVIHLNHNRLRELPERMLDMPNLLMAFVSSNQIRHISPRFDTERHFLRGIVLDDNCLSAADTARAAKRFRHFFMFSAGDQRGTCGDVDAAVLSAGGTNPAATRDG